MYQPTRVDPAQCSSSSCRSNFFIVSITGTSTQGQTGSGKTYTMLGDSSEITESNGSSGAGLIPRICVELFQRLGLDEASRDPAGSLDGPQRASVLVSFCEVRRVCCKKVLDGIGVDCLEVTRLFLSLGSSVKQSAIVVSHPPPTPKVSATEIFPTRYPTHSDSSIRYITSKSGICSARGGIAII